MDQRIISELVVLQVHVRDGRGAPVSGLPQAAFSIFENDRPREVQFFSMADAPASIGLVIDSSGSMAARRAMTVAAAVAFVDLSNAEDELFVLAFNEHVREAWGPQRLGPSDEGTLRRALERGIGARGKTALYDAMAKGLSRLEGGQYGRRALVVISDGSDNASTSTTRESLTMQIDRSDAMIYTVALQDPVELDGNPRLLKTFARASGGEAFEPKQPKDLPDVLASIARDIRSVYTMGFVPSDSEGDGEALRTLRVVATSADGKRLDVRTRTGYRVGEKRER